MKMAKNKKNKAKATQTNKVSNADANNNKITNETNIGFENDTKDCK